MNDGIYNIYTIIFDVTNNIYIMKLSFYNTKANKTTYCRVTDKDQYSFSIGIRLDSLDESNNVLRTLEGLIKNLLDKGFDQKKVRKHVQKVTRDGYDKIISNVWPYFDLKGFEEEYGEILSASPSHISTHRLMVFAPGILLSELQSIVDNGYEMTFFDLEFFNECMEEDFLELNLPKVIARMSWVISKENFYEIDLVDWVGFTSTLRDIKSYVDLCNMWAHTDLPIIFVTAALNQWKLIDEEFREAMIEIQGEEYDCIEY
ncbi:MAG: hypothetical protein JXQ90_21665 [Cyclobacteriaceae bacterium]